MMWRGGLTLAIVVTLVVLSAGIPVLALAHGQPGGAQTMVQLLGQREVAVTIQPARQIPGPLLIEVRLRSGEPLPLLLRAAPAEQWPSAANQAVVRPLRNDPGPYLVQLQADRAGVWELELHEGDTAAIGAPHASIPFTLLQPKAVLQPSAVAFGGAGLLLLITIGAAFGARRPWMATLIVPSGLATMLTLTIAVTLAAQQSLTPVERPAAPPGYASLALRLNPPTPQAGKLLTLDLLLTDGGTGLPVDDLVPQHDALLHLVVIGADGAAFEHLHPSRVAPGRYHVELVPPQPGAYRAYVELTRNGGGSQLATQHFVVSGSAPPPSEIPGLGQRQIGNITIDVQAEQTPLRAGEPNTLALTVSADGRPIAIEPWLGMPGHMIVHSTTIFGHLHAMEVFPSAAGAQLRFVYTFPEPGVYWLWGQFGAEGQVVTVPIRLVVA